MLFNDAGNLATARRELVCLFLDSGVIQDLLVAGQERFGYHDAFVQRPRAAARPRDRVHHHVVDRLAAGELAVLRELPSLLPLREIAAARSVSVNTVKTHLRALHRKLGVNGRREAVEVARRRGLL